MFAASSADMVAAFTMNYVEEALGITLAARSAAMPVVIAFTVETDGRLPSGQSLGEAIEQTDAETANYPAYYMINCAHPTHFAAVLSAGGAWRNRIRGLRANASKRSHAELDSSPDLDIGSPAELGQEYRALRELFPHLNVRGSGNLAVIAARRGRAPEGKLMWRMSTFQHVGAQGAKPKADVLASNKERSG